MIEQPPVKIEKYFLRLSDLIRRIFSAYLQGKVIKAIRTFPRLVFFLSLFIVFFLLIAEFWYVDFTSQRSDADNLDLVLPNQALLTEKGSWQISHATSDFNPPNPPVNIAWIGKAYGDLTYGRIIFKNLTSNNQYKYFIAEPNDLIKDGALRYSPTTRSIRNDDVVIVSGEVEDFCFWYDGIDDTEYYGCVPWIDINKIEVVK